jgi:hypothetical protein
MIKKRLIITGFILLEIIFGLGFALLGGYIFSKFDKADITSSVLNTFIILFISMIFGVGLIGYFHLKYFEKLSIFGKSILSSCIGLIAFIILYIVINSLTFDYLPHYLSSVILPIVLPMTGAVLGFNFLIIKK